VREKEIGRWAFEALLHEALDPRTKTTMTTRERGRLEREGEDLRER
jgi:hypothetical protein